jgi:S-layer protein
MASTFGDYVLGLYAAIYKRAPDKAGYEYWAKNSDLNATAAAFAKHPQWNTDFPTSLTDAAYVDKIYSNILGIPGDSGGRAYWTDLISRNVLSRSSMVAGFVQAVLDFNPTSGAVGTDLLAAAFAAKTLRNKVSFSNAWLNSSKAVAAGVDSIGTAAYQESMDMLSSVTDDASLALATTALNNSTFVLTASTDNIIGSSFADSIVGDFSTSINNINISDQINGGAGVDTLKMYSAATTAALPLSILNVEILQFVSPSIAAGVTLDTTKINALTKVEITEANSNIATLTALPVIKTGNGVGLQLSTATNTTAPGQVWDASPTDSSLELTLNGFGRSQDPNATLLLSNETATSLTINSIGGFNGITLVSTNTLVNDIIKGSKDLRLTQTPSTTLKSVDASQATGNLQIDLSAGNQISGDFSFKGGFGNDKLVLSGTQLTSLTAATQLNGGEGLFDVLQLTDGNFTPAIYTVLNATVGFEWLSLASSKTVLDVSTLTNVKNIGIAATASTVTITGGSATTNFLIDNSQAHDTIAIGNQAGQTSASITLDNGSGTRAGTAALTISVANAINLNSTGVTTKAGGANSVTALTVVDNATITIGGDTDLTLTKITATTTGVKVDAAKFTGKLMLESSDKVDTLIGGSGNDTLSGGLEADSLTGGAGADSFVIKPTLVTGAGDSITDFTSGSDRLVLKKIDFTALASTVGTGFSTATDFVTIAGGVATAATDRIIFDSTNKIVYYDSDGSGSTAAVAIVTLVGQTVVASDFVITA